MRLIVLSLACLAVTGCAAPRHRSPSPDTIVVTMLPPPSTPPGPPIPTWRPADLPVHLPRMGAALIRPEVEQVLTTESMPAVPYRAAGATPLVNLRQAALSRIDQGWRRYCLHRSQMTAQDWEIVHATGAGAIPTDLHGRCYPPS